MAKLLRHHGARIDVEDVDGWTVLFPCGSAGMAAWLIAEGADPTRLDQCGFPCWNWVKDRDAREFLKQEALKRGLEKWTEL